jgi:hypothetical protein
MRLLGGPKKGVSQQFLTAWTKRLLRIGMPAGSSVTPETKVASNPAVTDVPGDHMVRRSEIITLNAPRAPFVTRSNTSLSIFVD